MRGLSVSAVLVAVLFIAGCGGGGGGGSTTQSALASKPAGVVVAQSAKAAQDASSFHMQGTIHASGQQIGVDLSLVRGKGATGTLTVGGAKVDIILAGNNGYLRGSPEFWKKYAGQAGGSGIAQLLQNKWLKFPAKSAQLGQLTAPTNAKALFKSLTNNHGKLENQGETSYNGQSVVAIKDTTKGGTLYVAASGTPYPAGLVKTGSEAGTITFDKWNEPVSLAAPKGALDFSHLTG